MIVYVLKCQHGKYYVGGTENPNILQEALLNRVAWTQMHTPEAVVETRQWNSFDDVDVNQLTKIYMKTHGINNVRGGVFSMPKFPQGVHELLSSELEDVENYDHNTCFGSDSDDDSPPLHLDYDPRDVNYDGAFPLPDDFPLHDQDSNDSF